MAGESKVDAAPDGAGIDPSGPNAPPGSSEVTAPAAGVEIQDDDRLDAPALVRPLH